MMLKELTLWSQKLRDGFQVAEAFCKEHADRLPKKFKKIAFIGMGGSGIAGRIIKTFLDKKEGLTTLIIDSPDLPGSVDTDTLAIVVTYSGNTWETLDALTQLTEKFIPTIVLTHGGMASKYAEKKNLPLVLLAESLSPRSALGNFLGFLLGLFEYYHLMEGMRKLNAFCHHADVYIPRFVDQQYFNDFLYAANGYDFFHIWGVSGSSAAFAYRAQTQFNENSKVQAIFSTFPELNHNLINGFSLYKQNPCVIFFYTDFLSKNLTMAIDATNDLLKEKGIILYKPPILGHTFEEQLFNIVLWADFASFFLGKARGIPIEDVKIIETLKNKQKSKGITY
jgi:glucose/mannose-6-phosphate isomerase